MTNSDEENATLEASGEFQRRVLSEVNAEWAHNPYVVLHGLLESVGAIAGAMSSMTERELTRCSVWWRLSRRVQTPPFSWRRRVSCGTDARGCSWY
jgi:hypothetical protein